MRRRAKTNEPTDDRKVRVRNLSSRPQYHGIYHIPANGQWVTVPFSLAQRLVGDHNYAVEGLWMPEGSLERSGDKVFRHPAACASKTIEIKSASDLADMRIQRIWRDDVERFEPEAWPSVLIVVPVFNSPDLLANCHKSLTGTLYDGKWDIAYVDNASADAKTKKFFASHAPSVTFDEPQGFSAAVNAGMRNRDYDYYVLFNQDCEVVDPFWLMHLVRWMEFRPQCGISGAKLLYPDGTIQHAGLDVPEKSCGSHRYLKCDPNMPEANYYERVMAVTGAVYCIRRSVFETLGGLDEGYKLGCEDTEFCIRAAVELGVEVWYNPSCVVKHIDNGVRKTNSKDSERIKQWAKESDAKFRKDWGSFVDTCATGRVDIVLPANDGTSGGCRVAWGIANSMVQAGIEAVVYTYDGKAPDDADFPILFRTRPLRDLAEADILIATRFDTVGETRNIPANKRWYLVQQIETCMAKYCGFTENDVLWSYAQDDYEIITIGEHLAKELAEFGRKSHILDVGFYRDLYKSSSGLRSRNPLHVLMYGSPADYKGGECAGRVASAIRKEFGGAVVIDSFHRTAPKPDWADNHYRPQTTSEVAKVYGEHDVYVYCSLSDGFAMTPIEAMACAVPVVVWDFAGKDQYAKSGENCLVAKYNDPVSVASAVRSIAGPKMRKTIAKQGLSVADRYDWSKVGLQYVNLVLRGKR